MTTANLQSLTGGEYSSRDRATPTSRIFDERHRHEQLSRRDDPIIHVALRCRHASIIDSNTQNVIARRDASTRDGAKADVPREMGQRRRDEVLESNAIVDGPGRMGLTRDEFEIDDALECLRSATHLARGDHRATLGVRRPAPSRDPYGFGDASIRAERRLELPGCGLRLETALQQIGVSLQRRVGVEVAP